MNNLNIGLAALNFGSALLIAALGVPLLQRKVKPNRWYGARFPKSFQSEELWYQINEYAGRRLILWAPLVALLGIAVLFLPIEGDELRVSLSAGAPLLYLIPCLQTYWFSRGL
jgi:hypothetical protein